MTTREAEARYLAEHIAKYDNAEWVVFNPHNKPVEDLPVVYAYSNGGPQYFISAIAMAEDGHVLATHCCSHEGYIPHDLGVVPNGWKNEKYEVHYPDGYRMEFVKSSELPDHEGCKAAYELNQELRRQSEETG